ncbi:NIPA-like protein 3 [Perkinsus olseni]|uniref:NIPA-like protein 3 n=1 Tax=Perkinsus olseni TaxID=32597 RepID=A0A7J6MF68_PEROL|nr:NIPA-like protein 3 [Perkinsus olseni]
MSATRFVIGIAVNIVGAITTNLGTVLMKYHTAVRHGKGHYLAIGLILFCIGSILTFGSFAFAPQSLLSGISAIQFVSNLFFVHYFLKEPFTVFNVCGTVVIIGAIVMLVISSNKSEAINNVDVMFRDFYFSATHGYFLLGLLTVILVIGFAFWMRTGAPILWFSKSKWPKRIQWELSLPRSQSRVTRFLVPTGYTFCVAAVGAQSVVSGKVLSLIITQAFGGHVTQLYQGRTFLVLFAWLFAAIFWVIHLNRALRIFPGAFLVPLTQVCWTLSTMLSGGIVFKEFVSMQSWQLGVFFSGTGVLFFGVFLLSPRTSEADQNQETSRRRSSVASSQNVRPSRSDSISAMSVANTPVSLNSISLPQYGGLLSPAGEGRHLGGPPLPSPRRLSGLSSGTIGTPDGESGNHRSCSPPPPRVRTMSMLSNSLSEGGPALVPYSNEVPPPPPLDGTRSPGGTHLTRQRTLTRIMSAMTVDAAAEIRREEGADLGGFVIEPRETQHHHHHRNNIDRTESARSAEQSHREESAPAGVEPTDDAELERRRSFRLRSVSVGTNSGDFDRTFPDPPYLRLSRWWTGRKRVKAEKKRLRRLRQREIRNGGFGNLASPSTETPHSADDQGDESSFGTIDNSVELNDLETGLRGARRESRGWRTSTGVSRTAAASSALRVAAPPPDTPPESMPSCSSAAVAGDDIGSRRSPDVSISQL